MEENIWAATLKNKGDLICYTIYKFIKFMRHTLELCRRAIEWRMREKEIIATNLIYAGKINHMLFI